MLSLRTVDNDEHAKAVGSTDGFEVLLAAMSRLKDVALVQEKALKLIVNVSGARQACSLSVRVTCNPLLLHYSSRSTAKR